MAWIVVLSRAEAARWVLANERMAFRSHVPVYRIAPGDSLAIYLTKGAFGKPHRNVARIIALGCFESKPVAESIDVEGESFPYTCDLRIDHALPLREGVEFAPLVASLRFVVSKSGWPAYLQRTLKWIPEEDFVTIEAAFLNHARQL